MSKKPDLVQQQLERIRKQASGKRRSNRKTDPKHPNSKTNSATAGREIDEYSNRDAAARAGAPRDPVVLGAAVDDLIELNNWDRQAQLATVMASWDQIVGVEFAQHVVPIGFEVDNSILVLQADSTAWANQTRLLTVELLNRIDETVGAGVVASVQINGPEPVRKIRGKYRVKGPGPRDTYG